MMKHRRFVSLSGLLLFYAFGVGPSRAFLITPSSPGGSLPQETTHDTHNHDNVVNTARRNGLFSRLGSLLPSSPQRMVSSQSSAASHSPDQNSVDTSSSSNASVLEVVLFGVGDLRVDDHGGLQRALSNTSPTTVVLPLLILNDDMLRHLPGAVAHTVDTVTLLQAAMTDLDQALRQQLELNLHTVVGDSRSVTEIVQDYVAATTSTTAASNNNHNQPKIRVHVCDLGPADNALRYGALGQLLSSSSSTSDEATAPSGNQWEIVTWDNGLRHHSFSDVAFARDLPDLFSEYESKYIKGQRPQKPVDASSYKRATATSTDDVDATERDIPSSTISQANGSSKTTSWSITPDPLPTVESLLETLIQVLSITDPDRIDAEIRTGLYGTHWGGLKAKTVGCRSVLDKLHTYTQTCQENEQAWSQHPDCPPIKRNTRSLEHASMEWQLRGTADNSNSIIPNSNNWLAGEAMTRYLAAPLWLGTISPRRVWHAAREENLFLSSPSPLRSLVEGQEWHRWLAARQIATNDAYRGQGKSSYRYWRYQGFLCRYAVTDFLSSEKQEEASHTKDGILLIHGFGASGAQWNKAMQEMSDRFHNEVDKASPNARLHQGLAPDLLGFGQSEKPAVSYTGYMWDSQMLDFAKEVAVHRHGWTSYITGGNSIGGFTSLSLAACDQTTGHPAAVTSSGAPGTQRCQGLVLMNSAGPVKTAAEIAVEQNKGLQMETIAQATAQDGLPACKPPPRPIGRAIGSVLLAYLRPRIQSICVNLYPTNPAAVNTELCQDILRDSLDPGAINVMMAGAKLPAPRTANELLGADFGSAKQHNDIGSNAERGVPESWFDGPVLIAQGVLDPLNDARDRMERYGALRSGIATDAIPAGHCPHDERPDLVAQSVVQWWTATRTGVARTTTPTVSTASMTNAATKTVRR